MANRKTLGQKPEWVSDAVKIALAALATSATVRIMVELHINITLNF